MTHFVSLVAISIYDNAGGSLFPKCAKKEWMNKKIGWSGKKWPFSKTQQTIKWSYQSWGGEGEEGMRIIGRGERQKEDEVVVWRRRVWVWDNWGKEIPLGEFWSIAIKQYNKLIGSTSSEEETEILIYAFPPNCFGGSFVSLVVVVLKTGDKCGLPLYRITLGQCKSDNNNR